MKIEKISINNFKAFKNLEFDCNDEFNFIVGKNNIGKSTIFEAIHLWKAAFGELIQRKGEKKFYASSTNCYLSFDSLDFLRIMDDFDIFNDHKKKLKITITFSHNDKIYPLEIELEKVTISNTYFRIYHNEDVFNDFALIIEELKFSLKKTISVYQTRPISQSIKREPFYNNAQLLKKISLGKSHEIIRNKILKSKKPDNKWLSLESRISNVLGSNYIIRFKNKNLNDDEYVRITIQEEGQKEMEISLMGSGILQILEIFSTLEFINKQEYCINVLLIDEPDSHIHSNIQANLIDELRNCTECQTFIISHNERFINKANDGELFYLSDVTNEKSIVSLPPSSYCIIENELANKLLSLDDIQRNKIQIITEGKTDKVLIETAWGKLYPTEEMPYNITSSGIGLDENTRTGNADSVRRTVEFLSTISDVKLIGLFDNDREGNVQFKGLQKSIFEKHSKEVFHRKHKTKNMYGLLLPVPTNRKEFITDNDITQRYFVIEHYFSNEILVQNQMKGNNILNTNVFEISGNKDVFSRTVAQLNKEVFLDFEKLFNKINDLYS